MGLLDILKQALHLTSSTDVDRKIVDLDKRQGHQIDRVQRLYGDEWNRQKWDAWNSGQDREGC